MIYGVGTMLTRFINILLPPVFTSYLSPNDYGILALLALLSMVAIPVFSLGLGASMGPNYFEDNSVVGKSQATWTAFIVLFVSVSILLSISWIFPKELSLLVFQSSESGFLVSLTLTGCAFNILSLPFTLRIQFEKKARLFVIITLISTATSILLSCIAVVFLDWGLKGMVFSQLAGQTITFLLLFIFGSRGTTFLYNKATQNGLLSLGVPLIPSFAFLFVLTQGNRLILQRLEGLEQLGVYSIGFSIGTAMTIAISGFTQAWYPFFMEYINKQEECCEIFGKIARIYVFLFGSLTLCFFIFANPAVLLLTKPAFHEAYKIIGFSALTQFFIGLASILMPGMYFSREVKYISLWQGVAAGISVPLNIVFIHLWGLLGAGFALAISGALLPSIQWMWNWYRRRVYIPVDYRWRWLSAFTTAFIILMTMSLVIVPSDLFWSIVFSFTMSALLAAVIYKNFYLIGSFSLFHKLLA